MTALSVNNLVLVKSNWAHGWGAGKLHRASVSFNCIKPPLRHSSQLICLILARFDQGNIHRHHVFFHQFYYHVKLPSNEHLTCDFGSYSGFVGKGVWDPFIDRSRISEQMQGGRLLEDCQVHSFNNGIEFSEVNMLGVLFWTYPTSILYYNPIIYKRHAGCIDLYAKGLAVDAPYAPRRVSLVHSGENLFNQGVEWDVVNFVIPSSGNVRCSLLDEHHSYMNPATHGKVPNQFAS